MGGTFNVGHTRLGVALSTLCDSWGCCCFQVWWQSGALAFRDQYPQGKLTLNVTTPMLAPWATACLYACWYLGRFACCHTQVGIRQTQRPAFTMKADWALDHSWCIHAYSDHSFKAQKLCACLSICKLAIRYLEQHVTCDMKGQSKLNKHVTRVAHASYVSNLRSLSPFKQHYFIVVMLSFLLLNYFYYNHKACQSCLHARLFSVFEP